MVLLDIKRICQENVSASTPKSLFFVTQRSEGLLDSLKDFQRFEGLLDSLKDLSLDPNQLNNKEARARLDTLWTETCSRLEKISLNENTTLFVAAITHLASSIKQQPSSSTNAPH